LGPTSRERVTLNFLERFGPVELRWLLEALARGDSGQEIATRFDVSRERVRQWKNTFGQVVTLYQVHPEVQKLVQEAEKPAPPKPAPPTGSGAGVYLVED
jgi:hypothetical protein